MMGILRTFKYVMKKYPQVCTLHEGLVTVHFKDAQIDRPSLP